MSKDFQDIQFKIRPGLRFPQWLFAGLVETVFSDLGSTYEADQPLSGTTNGKPHGLMVIPI